MNKRDLKYKIKTRTKFLKLLVIDDLTSTTINSETQKVVDKNSKVITDDYKLHSKLRKMSKNTKRIIQKIMIAKRAALDSQSHSRILDKPLLCDL